MPCADFGWRPAVIFANRCCLPCRCLGGFESVRNLRETEAVEWLDPRLAVQEVDDLVQDVRVHRDLE